MNQIPLQNWQSTGTFLTYRGHQIFTRVEGNPSAPALLLIHGFPTASWDWEAIWPTLAQQYRVLTLDMIGFGYSAKPTDYNYSILDQADLFEHLLKQHNVTEYHILAHDYGDTVAQELLARQTDQGQRPQLKSVCFLNGGLFPETHHPLLIQKLLLSPLGSLIARLNNRKQFSQNMKRVFGPQTQPDAALLDSFWQLFSINQGSRILPKLIGYMPERKQHRARWVGALQHATIPLKLIDGMVDPVSGAHMVARYRELIPQPNVTELEHIGHYPQVEAPQAVLDAYLAFRKTLET
ncbi:MAG: alpha/beta hydrolase [Gammaproteobacteria bacterium]|nr:alpha/beta hydrolase [Gammaproteobacteria bacterium]